MLGVEYGPAESAEQVRPKQSATRTEHVLAEGDPGNKPNAEIDPQVTATFPAGGLPGALGGDEPSDADSWVAQWSGQFDDETSKPAKDGRDAAEIAAWQKAQERTRRRAKLRANQRMAETVTRYRPQPDEIQATTPFPVVRDPHRRNGRRLMAVSAMALVGALAAVGYVLVLSDAAGNSDTAGDTIEEVPDLSINADLDPVGVQELARSTVQLVGLNDQNQPECAGSGVIVEIDGTILTNAHVVTRTEACPFRTIGVGVTASSTSSAELQYQAEVLAVDAELDLAVLRIAGPLDPASGLEMPDSFPAARLGDSDTVRLGDGIRVLGYPVIGGDTITLTTGTVSGFSSEVGIGDRAMIKTDASISSGNSGGMAIDGNGRVIGIPTKARASESGPAIDCRPVSDTNDDGLLDEADGCVPVGGFLNGVRPINLARQLLARAASAEPITPPVGLSELAENFDPNDVVISNPRFSIGHDGNLPRLEVVTAAAGISELCFFVDWSGIPTGVNLEGAWFIDGQQEPAFGEGERQWTLADEGRNFWLCAREKNALGLPAGVYEIGFFIEGQLVFAEGIELTPEPVDVVTITWTNDLETDLCGLAINPKASGQVGLDELDEDVVIPPGGAVTMDLPLGTVVVEAYDCDGEPVADELAGLPITKSEIFSIGL